MWRGRGFAGIFKQYHKVQATRDSCRLAWEIAEIPRGGALHNKIAMNTDLKILGVDALFDYYGQMNRFSRFVFRE